MCSNVTIYLIIVINRLYHLLYECWLRKSCVTLKDVNDSYRHTRAHTHLRYIKIEFYSFFHFKAILIV